MILSAPAGATVSLDLSRSQSLRMDPVSSLNIAWTLKLSKTTEFSVSQGFSQNYYIYDGDSGFTWNDTKFAFSFSPTLPYKKWSTSGGVSFTLPVSKRSQEDNVYSIISGNGGISFLPSKRISLGLTGLLDLYTSKYDTGKSSPSQAGAALPMFRYGASQSGKISIGFLSLAYSLTQLEILYNEIEEEAPNSSAENIPDQTFIASFTATVTWENLYGYTGISQGNSLILPGFDDYIIFDEDFTSYFMGIGAAI